MAPSQAPLSLAQWRLTKAGYLSFLEAALGGNISSDDVAEKAAQSQEPGRIAPPDSLAYLTMQYHGGPNDATLMELYCIYCMVKNYN